MKNKFIFLLIVLFLATPLSAAEQPGLQVGQTAPDFEAKTHRGETVRLSEYYQESPVVLLFYRGGWCLYCNRQIQEYRVLQDQFEQLSVKIIAVSVDRPEKTAVTVAEQELKFDMISDSGARLLELYNVVYYVPDELAEKYREEYNIDLEAASGRDDHLIAVPATYVIDTKGKIIYAHADENYKERPGADEILNIIREKTGGK